MAARMKNPAMLLPEAAAAVQDLYKAIGKGGVPKSTLDLIHLRASQINGCSACVNSGTRNARKAGETDERLDALAAWRETSYYTDAERAALVLTESATRLADQPDPVPDHIWAAAAEHYSDQELASVVLMIAITSLFNRVGRTTGQVAGG